MAKTPQSALTKAQNELLIHLFGSQPSTLRASLTDWLTSSSRYFAFVQAHKDKVRKKIRAKREPDAAADLLAELKVPYWLLHEKRFEVAYEPYAAAKARGPDYAVTFRDNFIFNIEITQMRGLHAVPAHLRGIAIDIDLRMVDVLCGKLRQLRANMANMLLVAGKRSQLDEVALSTHLAWIKEKAERGDQFFYTRQRFSGAAEFFKYYERLSGIIAQPVVTDRPRSLWLNSQARIRLPDQLKAALERMM